jgi:hypothetical protein
VKPSVLFLGAVLILASAPEARPKESGADCHKLSVKVRALITEYQELRERRRQLPEGSYDKDLRDHGGKLHSVLASLGNELGHPPFTKRIIVECVGEPDAIKNGREMAPYLGIYDRDVGKAGRKPDRKKDRQNLVYEWRGGHDFMFFIVERGVIVDHGWWFAYE